MKLILKLFFKIDDPKINMGSLELMKIFVSILILPSQNFNKKLIEKLIKFKLKLKLFLRIFEIVNC